MRDYIFIKKCVRSFIEVVIMFDCFCLYLYMYMAIKHKVSADHFYPCTRARIYNAIQKKKKK